MCLVQTIVSVGKKYMGVLEKRGMVDLPYALG